MNSVRFGGMEVASAGIPRNLKGGREIIVRLNDDGVPDRTNFYEYLNHADGLVIQADKNGVKINGSNVAILARRDPELPDALYMLLARMKTPRELTNLPEIKQYIQKALEDHFDLAHERAGSGGGRTLITAVAGLFRRRGGAGSDEIMAEE